MNRSLWVVVMLVACKPSTETRSEPNATARPSVVPVGIPAPTFSTEPIVPAPPAALVQVVIPRWLAMLQTGRDEDFLRDAAVAEETHKLLDHQSMGEIAKDFKAKRHATVVKILTSTANATPTQVTTEGTRTLVRFRIAGEKDATFIDDADHVTLKGVYGP